MKEELQSISNRFDQLIKLQEDSSRRTSLSIEKAKEDVTNTSMMGDLQGGGGTTIFLGSCQDFRFIKLEMSVFEPILMGGF